MAGLVVLVGVALVVTGTTALWGPWWGCLVGGGLLLAPTALRTAAAARRSGGEPR